MKRSDLERLSDAELEKLYNDTQSDIKRKDRQYDMLPAAWADRAGAPAIAELARAERAALLSFLPTHRPWDDVTAYDVGIFELEQDVSRTMERVRDLSEQVANEPQRHADAVAQWVLDGSKGKRPESRTDELQRQLAEAEADRDGHQIAHDRLLEQRAEHIEKNRGRLVKTVDRLVDEKQRRMLALIDELEQARAALAQAREAALWARTFPAEQAGRMPRWQTFAGGLRRVLEPLGLRAEVDAGRFFNALRGDVEWLRDAVGAEQRALVHGKPQTDVRREAVWSETDEGQEADRAEKQRLLEQYRNEWGHHPK